MIRSLFLVTGALVWITTVAIGGWFAVAGAIHVTTRGRGR